MKYIFSPSFLIAFFLLIGCDSNDPEPAESEIDAVAITPGTAVMNVGDQVDFTIAALTAAGDTVHDANLDVRWWSTDSTVFDVEDGGTAIARNEGTAYCMVEVTELAKKLRFTGRDSAFVTVHLF